MSPTEEDTRREDRVNAAIAEWLDYLRQGRRADRREFLDRYADVSEELTGFLRDHGFFLHLSDRLPMPPK